MNSIVPDVERVEFTLRGERGVDWRFTDEQCQPVARQAARRAAMPRAATVAAGFTIMEKVGETHDRQDQVL